MLKFCWSYFCLWKQNQVVKKDYWSVDPDLRCDAFPETKTWNWFFELNLSFMLLIIIPLVIPEKVEPLYNPLNQKLQAYGIFQKDLSIDESMAPYYEGHSYKQFICAKQIRFGYKPWIPAGATGLPCNIEIHAEKSVNDTGEPLETRLLKNGLDVLERPRIHSVYFDDFFLSYQLLSGLDKKGFRATGTMKIQK